MNIRGILLLIFLLTLLSCSKEKEYYFDELEKMEQAGYRGEEIDTERIKEIKEGIDRYRKDVERKVKATSQIGIYYKMMAVQFMRANMYQEAYKNLEQAIAIQTENPILFYLSGVCTARISKAQDERGKRNIWLEKAEFHYNRALSLDPVYVDALYGLAILFTFELDRLADAENLLKKILLREKKNIDALFLLGNVYYRMGRAESAIEIYDTIVRISGVESNKNRAEENKKRIEGELYGSE